ncbi:Hypothetical protein, putative [Bodo saltans]|uniref:Uncharacterized protein n=1 Tax=Bodo saltans TaxID=75058 RepID=A0A0S4J950_BODSA|nr:Hypothetical protein, putative [Bodo saltans]|eukprot:CUG86879.1 Hypothetical protein, putative [Bodo saltans]
MASSIEYVHKDLAKLVVKHGDIDVPGVVQLHSRAIINICVFQTSDAQASRGRRHNTSSSGSQQVVPNAEIAEGKNLRLQTMIVDAVDGSIFDQAQPNVSISVSDRPYTCIGSTVQEVLVGLGDMSSSYFAGLDLALLSMRKGEESIFAATHRLGYALCSSDIIFKLTVAEVYGEIELVAPRKITKHIVHRPIEPVPDAYGFLTPVYGGQAIFLLSEIDRFTEKPIKGAGETVEIGGPDVPEWKTEALMSMQAGEYSTVRIESGAVYKLRLKEFTNPEPPRTIAKLREKIDQLKKSGNDLISRKHSRAHVRYQAGLFWLKLMQPRLIPKPDQDPESVAQLMELESLLEGNLSHALLEEGLYESAIDHATRALSLNAKAFKNYFRRAKAKKGLRQFQAAIADLNRAEDVLESLKILRESSEWKSIDDVRFEIDCEMSA